jgi:hypothetical protein
MKKRRVGLALLALAMLSVARNASADESVDPVPGLAFVGFGALDIGLAAADFSAGGRWRSRGYGGVEFAAGGAQFAICLHNALSSGPNGVPGPWEIGAGFGAIFMAHGLVTLLAPRSHARARPRQVPS